MTKDEALKQPKQEPVAEVVGVSMLGVNSPAGKHINAFVDIPVGTRLYTTQQQRKPLTCQTCESLARAVIMDQFGNGA